MDRGRLLRPNPGFGRSYTIGDKYKPSVNLRNAVDLAKALYRAHGLDRDSFGLGARPIWIPVPSQDAVSNVNEPERWGPMALARRLGGKHRCHDLVRWKKAPDKASHAGGERNFSKFVEEMTLIAPRPDGATAAIVVDDVLTTGSHMQAVAQLLINDGFLEVAGFCLGVTESEPVDNPWAPRTLELDTCGRV